MESPANRRKADDSYQHSTECRRSFLLKGSQVNTLYGYLMVFLGAGLGGMLRHSVNLVSPRVFGLDLPVGTLLINLTGSLLLGMAAGLFASRGHASHQVQLFLATGVLGGFTTFSAFSLEAALLWQRGQVVSCALYALASVVLAILAVFGGLAMVRMHPAV